MSRQLVEERPTAVDPPDRKRPMEWADLWNAFPAGTWVAAAAAVRGAVVAVTGIVATVSLAVVIWAITPQSGDDATAALHAGFAALAAANLLPISIGGVAFRLSPLLLTLLLGVLLASTARRGRFRPTGRAQEAMVTLVGGGVYGLLVLVLTRGFGDEGVVAPGVGPFVVGVLGFAVGTLGRDSACRAWWRAIVPQWVTVAVRATAVGSVALCGGAAALFAVSLGLHFSSALTVGSAIAPDGLDGAGLALLSVVYLPNAVLATLGYSVGAGVHVGPGSYLPWGATPAELPGLPLLAALPTAPGPSAALAALAVPVIAAGLLGWTVVRGGLPTRQDRVLAAVTAAVTSAVVVGLAVFAAGGGVGAGRWADIGSSAPVAAAVVAVGFALVGGAVAALTAVRTVPWRLGRVSSRPAQRRPRTTRRPASAASRPAAAGAGPAVAGTDAVDDDQEAGPDDEVASADEATVDGDPTDDTMDEDTTDDDESAAVAGDAAGIDDADASAEADTDDAHADEIDTDDADDGAGRPATPSASDVTPPADRA